jgi:hypothetical protein
MKTRLGSILGPCAQTLAIATLVILSLSLAHAQEQTKPGGHDMSGMSQDEMNKRGDKVMGFDHTKTTHHFRLSQDGGSIEVAANSVDDTASRDQIRKHLNHIAMMFAEGNFNAPMLIHDQNPPGVAAMQRLKKEIKYEFEETEVGARITISTKNPEALKAIYQFLRFQIREHKTGDSLDVSEVGRAELSRTTGGKADAALSWTF